MPTPGQIGVIRFPQTDPAAGKFRPVLVVAPCPGPHGDWLVALVSSQLHQRCRISTSSSPQRTPTSPAAGLK